jgi:chromosome segregation ATPase
MTVYNGFSTKVILSMTAAFFITSAVGAEDTISTMTVTSTSSTSTTSPTTSNSKLETINADIEKLSISLSEKAQEYPQIIEGIREKRLNIDQAEAQVEKMISDMELLTDKMDNASEYRTELVALRDQTKVLISQAEETEGLESFVGKLKIREQKLGNLDEKRAILVAEARAAIRDLRDNQKKLVLIKQINAIDEAIAILQKGLADFEGIVKDARAVTDQVNDIVAGN